MAQTASITAANAAKIAKDLTTRSNASQAITKASATKLNSTSTAAVLTAFNTWANQANAPSIGWIIKVQAKASSAQASYTLAAKAPKATKPTGASASLHAASSNLHNISCMHEYGKLRIMQHGGMLSAIIVIIAILCIFVYLFRQ
jgi:hypothetical protein